MLQFIPPTPEGPAVGCRIDGDRMVDPDARVRIVRVLNDTPTGSLSTYTVFDIERTDPGRIGSDELIARPRRWARRSGCRRRSTSPPASGTAARPCCPAAPRDPVPRVFPTIADMLQTPETSLAYTVTDQESPGGFHTQVAPVRSTGRRLPVTDGARVLGALELDAADLTTEFRHMAHGGSAKCRAHELDPVDLAVDVRATFQPGVEPLLAGRQRRSCLDAAGVLQKSPATKPLARSSRGYVTSRFAVQALVDRDPGRSGRHPERVCPGGHCRRSPGATSGSRGNVSKSGRCRRRS